MHGTSAEAVSCWVKYPPPSPVTATVHPDSWKARTIWSFCWGEVRAKTTSSNCKKAGQDWIKLFCDIRMYGKHLLPLRLGHGDELVSGEDETRGPVGFGEIGVEVCDLVESSVAWTFGISFHSVKASWERRLKRVQVAEVLDRRDGRRDDSALLGDGTCSERKVASHCVSRTSVNLRRFGGKRPTHPS